MRCLGRAVALVGLAQPATALAQTAGVETGTGTTIVPAPLNTVVVPATTTTTTGTQASPPQPAAPNAIPPTLPSTFTPDESLATPRVIPLTPAPPSPNPPAPGTPPPPAPSRPEFPSVVPIETGPTPDAPAGGPRYIRLGRDASGLIPDRPPGPAVPRDPADVSKHIDRLIDSVQDAEAEMTIAVNHSKLVETKRPLTRIAIANPTIADVELLNDQPNTRLVNLFGRSFGTTTITFWDADNKPVTFLVRVTIDTKDLENRIKQTFPGSLIHIRQVGPQVILEGQVPDAKTMSEVLQVVTMDIRNSGGMRGAAGGAGGAGGGAGAGAPAGGGGATMGGGGGMGGGAMPGGGGGGAGAGMAYLINRVKVPGPRQVLLHVKIAELNRSAIRELGISWLDTRNKALLASTIGNAASITGTVGPNTQTSVPGLRNIQGPIASTFTSAATAAAGPNAQLFGIFDAGQFSLFLNALRSNSVVKILAEPNLVTLDGQPAQFLAGGLFPYPVPQSSSIPGGTAVVTVQFANFGAILSFLPHILPNDVIRLDVAPVFSQLDFAQGTTINNGRVPAINQRSARTVVEMREGQTLAIAGLLESRSSNTTDRIPVLGDLPIVGPWFSHNRSEIIETELVVLVTPELVAPMDPVEVPPAPGDRVYQPNDYEFYFLGRIEGKLGREFRSTVRELDPINVMRHFQSENQWVIGPHGHAD
ncbi:MAG: pilus assembly protein N-terminal domain-containing protein [Isosphaeraceae bacterium]